jgi:hypothetical protein
VHDKNTRINGSIVYNICYIIVLWLFEALGMLQHASWDVKNSATRSNSALLCGFGTETRTVLASMVMHVYEFIDAIKQARRQAL